jgi:penicillin V acylase-like amidase (Ntn superfamily)
MFAKIAVSFCVFLNLIALATYGCSTFVIEKDSQFLVAKSYDWIVEDGLVIVNKRHIAKQAMTSDRPMQWISKYGSVVFTQAGRELPMGGMNEAGLVIELMYLADTTYPVPDSRYSIRELQWIQYQLDTARSVEEVLASNETLRIDRNSKSLNHFMIVDSSGHRAIIEFIDGQTVVRTRSEMLTPVLTNHTYQACIEYLEKHQNFGGSQLPQGGFDSLDRFVRIAALLREFSLSTSPADRDNAFRMTASVSNFGEVSGEATMENLISKMRAKWNIVYDISARTIHFLTGRHQTIRTIHLDAFDFEGNTDVLVLNMQEKLEGDVSRDFIPYTYELNRNLIHLWGTEVRGDF